MYDYLRKSGRHPNYLPQYYGPIRLTPDHVRAIKSLILDARGDTTAIYRVGVGIERIESSCLNENVNDMTDEELTIFEAPAPISLPDQQLSKAIARGRSPSSILPVTYNRRYTAAGVSGKEINQLDYWCRPMGLGIQFSEETGRTSF